MVKGDALSDPLYNPFVRHFYKEDKKKPTTNKTNHSKCLFGWLSIWNEQKQIVFRWKNCQYSVLGQTTHRWQYGLFIIQC